jgi:hypothetical protein
MALRPDRRRLGVDDRRKQQSLGASGWPIPRGGASPVRQPGNHRLLCTSTARGPITRPSLPAILLCQVESIGRDAPLTVAEKGRRADRRERAIGPQGGVPSHICSNNDPLSSWPSPPGPAAPCAASSSAGRAPGRRGARRRSGQSDVLNTNASTVLHPSAIAPCPAGWRPRVRGRCWRARCLPPAPL